jgi:hypothetical protein
MGMCSMLVPVMPRKSSITICVPTPAPAELYVSLPGCALARAMSSFRSRAGSPFLATST